MAKHKWDESLVIGVMVVSVIGILVMLSSYASVTGHAVLTNEVTLDMLTDAKVITGNGKTRCDIVCAQDTRSCILAQSGNSLTTCGAKISGEYQCVCATTLKVAGEVPEIKSVGSATAFFTAPGCVDDNDCAPDYVCYQGQCIYGEGEEDDGVVIDLCGGQCEGEEQCVDGKCEPTQLQLLDCIDPDNSYTPHATANPDSFDENSLFTKETVTGSPSILGLPTSFEDTCIDELTIAEGACLDENKYFTQELDCPEDYHCDGGSCIEGEEE